MPPLLAASGFDPATWSAGQSVLPATSGDVASTANAANHSNSGTQAARKAKDAGQQFEAMYLRQMLDEFMPKDSEALFGKGTAGMVWRSMLTDALATTLSKTGTIGIAQMIIKPKTTAPEGK
jgi:flagellar protein FlgJ